MKKPAGRFDIVICTDVLEHIPEHEIPIVLKEIDGYAWEIVFLSICTREARKTLPDGRNAHLTIKPPDWWKGKICEMGNTVDVVFT